MVPDPIEAPDARCQGQAGSMVMRVHTAVSRKARAAGCWLGVGAMARKAT